MSRETIDVRALAAAGVPGALARAGGDRNAAVAWR